MRFELKESREGFCRKGRARSFHVEGPKTEKEQEPSSGNSGTRNLEAENIKSTAESTRGFCQEFNCFKCAGDFIFNLKYIFSQEL